MRSIIFSLCVLLAGCSGSGLRVHAASAATATVALEVARTELLRETERRASACETDACVDAVRAELLPLVDARDSARLTVVAYREAVSVAASADALEDVASLLASSASRLACEWSSLSQQLARLGLTLPVLPVGICSEGGQ
jgi:chromosome condensin MukBEF ATPase and DNA-binding subunit MukB